tara:strand:+ start:49 stop:519 length:471 start_codon:yes stop_codon:yes gene_type:complete
MNPPLSSTTVRWQDTPQGESVLHIIKYLMYNFGGDVENPEIRKKWENFHMQELDGASVGSKFSKEWVKNIQIPEDKYKNALDDESEEAEAIQMALTMKIMRTSFTKKDKEKIRRNVVSFLMKPFPPFEGFDFDKFYGRDVKAKKKRLGKSYIEGVW